MIILLYLGAAFVYTVIGRACYTWLVRRYSVRWPDLWAHESDRRHIRHMCAGFATFWPVTMLLELIF